MLEVSYKKYKLSDLVKIRNGTVELPCVEEQNAIACLLQKYDANINIKRAVNDNLWEGRAAA